MTTQYTVYLNGNYYAWFSDEGLANNWMETHFPGENWEVKETLVFK